MSNAYLVPNDAYHNIHYHTVTVVVIDIIKELDSVCGDNFLRSSMFIQWCI